MKHSLLLFTFFIFVFLTVGICFAQDTAKKTPTQTAVVHIERQPAFPGGVPAFNKYIIKHLEYPEIAKLVGLSGNVIVSFTIEQDGAVTDVKPVKCLGAACESEAARVIAMMPKWTPGIYDGKPVRVRYSVPINFYMTSDGSKVTTRIRDLRNANYGFYFYINGKTYTLDEAQTIIGKTFDAATIAAIENDNDPQHAMPDKKGVYLIAMKVGA